MPRKSSPKEEDETDLLYRAAGEIASDMARTYAGRLDFKPELYAIALGRALGTALGTLYHMRHWDPGESRARQVRDKAIEFVDLEMERAYAVLQRDFPSKHH